MAYYAPDHGASPLMHHGAGPSATQSTALNQPAKTTHGTLGDVLDFDGTNDRLVIDGLSTASTSHTIIVVADMNATTATSRAIIDWQTGRYAWLQEFFSGDNVSVIDSAVRALTAGTVGAQVLTLTNAAGAITLYRARASVGTTTGVARALGGTARIGSDFTGGAPADMQLAALFVWQARARCACAKLITDLSGDEPLAHHDPPLRRAHPLRLRVPDVRARRVHHAHARDRGAARGVDDIAWQWAADPALPTIDTPRCDVALSEIDLRTATEREWIDELRLCPMMPDGCSRAPGCTGGCATGVVYRIAGAWRVYLSPGESADGHGITVRHEAAHVLSWCTGRGLDYSHSRADVWGPQGVVWRRVDGA